MWVFLAIDSARVDEFRAALPEYGITHKNVIKCNMDHDGPDLSLAKHHVMTIQYTRCVSALCYPAGEDQAQPLRCPGSYRFQPALNSDCQHRDGHHVVNFNRMMEMHVCMGEVELGHFEIKNALATWIDDDPKHNPKTLFMILKASIGQDKFGGMPCPT
ncbi:hypothetical protein AaE_006740, partial [Aphanomyces astaci]